MKSLPERNVKDLALARLRALFPESRLVRELNKVDAVNTSARCAEKGCVFPSFVHGRCRAHAADLQAQYSVMPSVSGTGNYVAA